MGFLQTFLEALKTLVGLAMLGLLWVLDTDSGLLSVEPFLGVQKGGKHTQTCELRISEKHPYPD